GVLRATIRSAAIGAAAVAAAAVGSPASAQDSDPIKIGAIYILSGSAATYGEFARDGIQMAVDEINAQGALTGRTPEVQREVSRGQANLAIQAARTLVYQDEVDLLTGIDSSGVANGIAPVVSDLQRPFLITHAATPDVTGKLCNE